MMGDTSSATSGVARGSVPTNVLTGSIRSEPTGTIEVRNPVTSSASPRTYCHTCSLSHDPFPCPSALNTVRVTEQASENGLRTDGFSYVDEVRPQGLSNCDSPASEVGSNHSKHSFNHSNSKEIFEDSNSSSKISAPAPNLTQLEEQYDKQFNEFAHSLYHALREHDPVRADSILFSQQTPIDRIPHNQRPPSRPYQTPYQAHTPYQDTYVPTPAPAPEVLLQSPIEPSEPSSSDSSSTSSTSSWDTNSSSESQKSKKKGGKKKKKQKSKKNSKKRKPFRPSSPTYQIPNTTSWTSREFKTGLQDLLTYDWDMTGLHILSLYKDDELLLYHTLHKHKFKLEQAKIAKVQKDLLETAKKQNLESLKHSDDPLECRRFFTRWIKSLRTMLLCFPKFANIIDPQHKIGKLPSDMDSENYSLFILVNAFVQGYWKNVISRPRISGRGDKALATLHSMCMTLTTQMKYEYNNRFTSITMDPNKPVSMFLRKFSISKQHAEDAGFNFSNSKLVDMCLNAIYKSNVPKYKTQAQIFQNQRAEGRRLEFAAVEQVFNNMDFSLEKTTGITS